jgi:hypothetical protein
MRSKCHFPQPPTQAWRESSCFRKGLAQTVLKYQPTGGGGSGTPVAFPAVALINARSIAARQRIDVLKLGVNYTFGWGLGVETY